MSNIEASNVDEIAFKAPESSSWDIYRPTLAWRAVDASGLTAAFGAEGPVFPPISGARSAHLALKRGVDLVLCIGALLVLAPFLVLVALMIKLTSKGPVLFRQMREGLDGQLFLAYKFRTMKIEDCDASGVAQTQQGDTRVTAVGRVLRRLSIDELPQLFNVLLGNMSLVGPRPHVANMMAGGVPYRDLVNYYDYRLLMKPGITGWAQAMGYRGRTDNSRLARARIDHDVAYVQNFSVLLDFKIMILTVCKELFSQSAD